MQLEIYSLALKIDEIVHAKNIDHLRRIGQRVRSLPLTEDTLAVLRSVYEIRMEHLKEHLNES